MPCETKLRSMKPSPKALPKGTVCVKDKVIILAGVGGPVRRVVDYYCSIRIRVPGLLNEE